MVFLPEKLLNKTTLEKLKNYLVLMCYDKILIN